MGQTPSQDFYEPMPVLIQEDNGIDYRPNNRWVEEKLAEQADMQSRFCSTVRDMLAKQARNGGGDSYWGVTQTAERIFIFACSLAGGDPGCVQELEQALKEDLKAAGPQSDQARQTCEAAMELFSQGLQAIAEEAGSQPETEQ